MVFRRFSTNAVHVFEIQWDKYHRPKFVINFSEAPLGGVEFGEKWMDSKDIAPVHCGTYLHLMRSRGRFTYKWFQLRRLLIEQLVLLKRYYEPDEVSTQVVQRFDEVEDWWANKVIGRHVLSF
jgi:hypothetical protein